MVVLQVSESQYKPIAQGDVTLGGTAGGAGRRRLAPLPRAAGVVAV
jgi:hypothetical protein